MVQVGDMWAPGDDDILQVYDMLALADDKLVEDGWWHVKAGEMKVLNDIWIRDYVLE